MLLPENAIVRQANPARIAVGYAIFSVISTVIASYIEGSLWVNRSQFVHGKELVNYSLLNNISTLLDFAILNPLAIYFLIDARRLSIEVTRQFRREQLISPYHRLGLMALSAMLAIKLMMFYFDGFISGESFDAIISVDSRGQAYISKTGWVVFLWTATFMSILFYSVGENIAYALFLLSLRITDVGYSPFHPDESGGLGYLLQPSVRFLRAMGVLLITFLIFFIYDFLLNDISESKRIFGFAIYIAIVIPVFFVPLFHIHGLMKTHVQHIASEYLSMADQKYMISPVARIAAKKLDIGDVATMLVAIENRKKLLKQLPAWPMPIRSITEQVVPLITACAPIAQKVILAAIPVIHK